MKKIIPLFFLIILSFCVIRPVCAEKSDDSVIEGWAIEKIVNARKVYSIYSEKASFNNKRIGFFNIALVKVINLDNVCLTLYNNGTIVKTLYFNKAVYDINRRSLLDDHGNVIFNEQSSVD